METEQRENALPVIGFTLGDYNGIGPEVVIKVLQDSRLFKFFIPVVYGSQRVLSRYRKWLGIELTYQVVQPDQPLSDKKINLVPCWEDFHEPAPGQITPQAGMAAVKALRASAEDLKNGRIHAIVTGPINKYNVQSEEFPYPGHTEFYADVFQAKDCLMLLVSQGLRIGTVTGHVPLHQVAQELTQEKITSKIEILLQSLRKDFAIRKPRVAVLALNPHAGENGLLGQEESTLIAPAVELFRQKGELVLGPYPADGFFGKHQYRHFDAVLAMYHDQGLIPFKMMAFESGVNFTAGLPIVRTSPDHGTAYDIAGKGIADESSLRSAVFTALDILKYRQLAPLERKQEQESNEKLVSILQQEDEKPPTQEENATGFE
ncbi:MAG: 4-hydroxythreonine-4-phosphate dehydrogenase PdxA [Cytophagales bacterium]|nr:4-hydroxythreonine-4-phosphate dehydrogenase PdxA [Bernardetiaceae bacterium]MDW8210863.1 4-hydroxythreonine-4-phosphate dehydrogenase PdxA [Cytophagales bacterium]